MTVDQFLFVLIGSIDIHLRRILLNVQFLKFCLVLFYLLTKLRPVLFGLIDLIHDRFDLMKTLLCFLIKGIDFALSSEKIRRILERSAGECSARCQVLSFKRHYPECIIVFFWLMD